MKREAEDKQLCIAVHTIECSIIAPRHIKINQLDCTALHNTIHNDAFKPGIKHQIFINSTIIRFCSNYTLLHSATTLSIDPADYWTMAREYSISNDTIASLQF